MVKCTTIFRAYSSTPRMIATAILSCSPARGGPSARAETAWFKSQIEDPSVFRDIGPEAKRIITSMLDLEKPIICRLNGAAPALRATIALLCDVIIASESHHRRSACEGGLVAGDGGAVIWPQLIGFARAKNC